MIRFLELSKKIKARLEEIAELKGHVVVYSTDDQANDEFDRKMGMLSGRCVIVRLHTAKNTNGNRKSSFYAGSYTLALYTVPVFESKAPKKHAALLTEIEAKLQGWWPAEVASNTAMWITVDAAKFDQQFTMKDGTTICTASTLHFSAPGNLK